MIVLRGERRSRPYHILRGFACYQHWILHFEGGQYDCLIMNEKISNEVGESMLTETERKITLSRKEAINRLMNSGISQETIRGSVVKEVGSSYLFGWDKSIMEDWVEFLKQFPDATVQGTAYEGA